MDYRDKLHKNKQFLTNPLRVALFAAGLVLLHQPVAALAETASTIEAGSGTVSETKQDSTYGTTKVVDSEETETARANWVQEGDDWYYLLPDGSKNRQDLQFDNAIYKFNWNGSLNDEKRQYDRYAGFIMDEKLNQAAAHRLEAALANGYSGDAIPGEGTLKDYLGKISYRKNSSCRELYLRGREDVDDAFDKLIGKTQDKYDSNGKRKDSLDYYRRVGMAHAEKDGEQYFMVILMR